LHSTISIQEHKHQWILGEYNGTEVILTWHQGWQDLTCHWLLS